MEIRDELEKMFRSYSTKTLKASLELDLKLRKQIEMRIKVVEEILNEREPDIKSRQFSD